MLRVHPDYRHLGIGSKLVTSRLTTMMGIDAPERLKPKSGQAAMVMTNITANNTSSLLTQFKSTVSTPIIWSAGFDMDFPNRPAVFYVVHPPKSALSYDQLPILESTDINKIGTNFSKLSSLVSLPGVIENFLRARFVKFSRRLEEGHVAWLNPEDPNQLNFSKRPEGFHPHTSPLTSNGIGLGSGN
jgi:hypothetical protein